MQASLSSVFECLFVGFVSFVLCFPCFVCFVLPDLVLFLSI